MNNLPPFVDIHVHPDLKSFLSSNDEISRNDCWKDIDLPPAGWIINYLLDNILESQSSLSQLDSNKGMIAMLGLYAFEKAMVKGDLELLRPLHINLLKISGILEFFRCRKILDHELMRRIARCYTLGFNLFSESLSHLVLSGPHTPGYVLLKKIQDYNPSKLNIILTAEGGHNLIKKKFSCRVRKQVLRNISELKNGKYRFLFIGPAHIERNRLCTHAYAIKILKHRGFIPKGYGITRLGRRVIRELLNEPRILIDVKHMSLESRKQYYRMLEEEYRNMDIPIIASHVGVTGVSYNHMPIDGCTRRCTLTEVLYHQPPGHISGTKFNPWSINLYDEEIIKIVESKGLIGLSLDARILGARQKQEKDLTEYFSNREFVCPSHDRISLPWIKKPAVSVTEPSERSEGNDARKKPEKNEVIESIEAELNLFKKQFLDKIRDIIKHPGRHKDVKKELKPFIEQFKTLEEKRNLLASFLHPNDLDHLCNNILHIVKTAGQDAWKHICIGSDFDGLVEAVDCCMNVTWYKEFSDLLKDRLSQLSRDFPSLIPVNEVDRIVDGFVSHNVYDFLVRNFN
jgi:microsomal dipeptidase-like Zn-dependent dipeptidase